MQTFTLFGEHLSHSMSVEIHKKFFEITGINGEYSLTEIPKDKFAGTARGIISRYNGVNVTIPYKKEVIPCLDDIDEAARAIGAVNTVFNDDGHLTGYNTDAFGFTAMLRRHNIHPEGQHCFVLGTGGASNAAVYALQCMDAASVTRVSRIPGENQIGYDELPDKFSGILINTTPVGMFPNNSGCPLSADAMEKIFPKCLAVADMIYNPEETVLTKAAKAAGVPACTGLYMLVAQAVRAQEIWQREVYSTDVIDKIYDKIRN